MTSECSAVWIFHLVNNCFVLGDTLNRLHFALRDPVTTEHDRLKTAVILLWHYACFITCRPEKN